MADQDGLDIFFPPADVTDDYEPEPLERVEEETNVPAANESREEPKFEDDIFKKWFRTRDKQGFLSLRGWLSAGKVSIDIGEVTDKGPVNTQVWTDAVPFAVYLRSVTSGTASTLYPPRDNMPAESFVHYGGSKSGGNPVARVLKVNYWQRGQGENKSYDETAFAFKAGHFKGRETSSGAFIPDMSSPLSVNMIKMSRLEVAEMSYRLDLALVNFASGTSDDIFRALNGNNR